MRKALVAISLFTVPLAAQDHAAHMAAGNWTAAHDSVMLPIKQLFDGMRAHDSAMVRAVFAPGAVLMAPLPRTGLPSSVKFEGADGFVAAVGRPDKPWNEQIYDPIVQIDGGLATAWVFYTFHHGDTFSHCGVDAIQLVRTEAGWKIAALADTRRATDCETAGKRKT